MSSIAVAIKKAIAIKNFLPENSPKKMKNKRLLQVFFQEVFPKQFLASKHQRRFCFFIFWGAVFR